MADDRAELISYRDAADLRRPLLLLAFEGLFDAAGAATSALKWIVERTESAKIAAIDPEGFFNFQESRPMARIADDGQRVIDWPETEVYSIRTDSARDLVIMTGVEPHLRWLTFTEHVLEVARFNRCEMVVTVGASVSMVPHTRPFSVTGSAVHPELARRLNLSRPSYQGPTGLLGVINERLERSNIPVISLRVDVPHYVPSPPNPKATRALLRRLQQTTGVETGYESLDGDVVDWVERVDQAVAADTDSQHYVERLERQVDSDEELLPSGDDLAAELEAFLREQGDDDGPADPGDGPADPGDGPADPGDGPADPGDGPADESDGPADESDGGSDPA